jgi:hypothetical protein
VADELSKNAKKKFLENLDSFMFSPHPDDVDTPGAQGLFQYMDSPWQTFSGIKSVELEGNWDVNEDATLESFKEMSNNSAKAKLEFEVVGQTYEQIAKLMGAKIEEMKKTFETSAAKLYSSKHAVPGGKYHEGPFDDCTINCCVASRRVSEKKVSGGFASGGYVNQKVYTGISEGSEVTFSGGNTVTMHMGGGGGSGGIVGHSLNGGGGGGAYSITPQQVYVSQVVLKKLGENTSAS